MLRCRGCGVEFEPNQKLGQIYCEYSCKQNFKTLYRYYKVKAEHGITLPVFFRRERIKRRKANASKANQTN